MNEKDQEGGPETETGKQEKGGKGSVLRVTSAG